MLHFFKKLFHRSPDTAAAASLPATEAPVSPPPIPTGARATAPTAEGLSPVDPTPPAVPMAILLPSNPPTDAAPAEAAPNEAPDCLKIPVGLLLPVAGDELHRFLSPHNAEHVLAPVNRLVPQLAQGEVALPLGELRRFSPNVLLDIPLPDDHPVRLPLAEVVRQLGPTHYTRRQNQKFIAVPDEILGLFGHKDQRVTVSNTPFKEPPKPAPAPVPPAPAMAKLAPAPFSPAPVPAQPIVPGLATPAPLPPISMPPLQGRPLPLHPSPSSAPLRLPQSPAPANPAPPFAQSAPLIPCFSNPTSRATTPAPAASKPAPAYHGETVRVSLAQISERWLEEVRRDMEALGVGQSHVALPMEALEHALKAGQVLFSWKQICSWLDPHLTLAPSRIAAEMLVELPLDIIAPLFIARFKPAAGQRRTEISADIPELFGKNGNLLRQPPSGPAAAPAPTPAPAAPTPAPVTALRLPAAPPTHAAPAAFKPAPPIPLRPEAKPLPLSFTVAPQPPKPALPPSQPASAVPTPAPALPLPAAPPVSPPTPAAPKAADPVFDLEQVLGPQGQRFGAREIVLNTARLPGAAGALLAMNDGLLVTSAVPPQVKGEMVAAFLPQIFGRMGQYTRELSMGALRGLTFEVEGGSWQVVKEPNIYFAVLNRPDKAMPLSQLAAIAAELNKQQQ